MSPILTGVIASGISGNLTPPWSPEGAYDALATVIAPSGGVSSITFNGIPSGYKHLQIRATSRISAGSNNASVRFNDDSAGNYAQHQLYGDGSATGAGGGGYAVPQDKAMFNMTGSGQSANIFGVGILDILDYQNTAKLKTVRIFTGYDDNGGGFAILRTMLWNSTSAINSITVFPPGTSFAENSQFALYGVK